MSRVVINQREYAWGDISVHMFGQEVLGIRGVEYKSGKAKEALRAAGRHPRAIQHGEYSHDGTLTILQSELEALERTAQANGYNSLLDVDFDIVVSYSTDNGVITVDKICRASITEMPKGMKQGDFYSEHALPFIALDIQRNIAG